MLVVIPSIIGGYNNIKNNLTGGSIILLEDTSNIDIIIKYINSKGYNIVPLSNLLEEQTCIVYFNINNKGIN